MFKTFQKSILSVVVLGFVGISLPAKADILLEPYLKYELSGTFSSTPTSGNATTYGQSGLGFGGRVGYQGMLIFVAADYAITSGTLKGQSTGTQDATMNETQLYVDVGVRLPLIRLYAGYGITNNVEGTVNSSSTTFEGSGVKVGAQFTGLPLVAINLEYVMPSYSKVKTSAGDQSLSDASISSVTDNVISLGVSIPFSL